MTTTFVRLKLDLARFDETPFVDQLEQARRQGVLFSDLAALGNTSLNHRKVYELNKACSADIPGRGPFYEFEDYVAERLSRPQDDPAGIILAMDGDRWIGMSASSYWPERQHVFAEMTGVVRDWRRRGLALALKVLALRYAKSKGVAEVATIHHAANLPPIALNRRLGFVDA